MGRRNWLFAGSETAGQRAAAIMSLLATAKANGREPQAWLTAAQKRTNHRWAKTRARVEHVFARIDLFRKGRLLRCTGLARTTVVIGLISFAHNLRRLATMVRLQQQAHANG